MRMHSFQVWVDLMPGWSGWQFRPWIQTSEPNGPPADGYRRFTFDITLPTLDDSESLIAAQSAVPVEITP